MPRKHLYLTQDAVDTLAKLSCDAKMKEGPYLSRLIIEKAENKNVSLCDIQEQLLRMHRSEVANGKNITAFMDMFNTFLKTFSIGGENESVYYPIDKEPHVWAKKALDNAEAKIRMAIYNRKEKSEKND